MVSAVHFNTPQGPDPAVAQTQQKPSNQSQSVAAQDKVTLSSQAQRSSSADLDHDGDQK